MSQCNSVVLHLMVAGVRMSHRSHEHVDSDARCIFVVLHLMVGCSSSPHRNMSMDME